MFVAPTSGPSTSQSEAQAQAEGSTSTSITVKDNKKSTATSAIPGVGIAKSKKVGKQSTASRKSRLKSEMGKEKALEREAVLAERVKGREERKVSQKKPLSMTPEILTSRNLVIPTSLHHNTLYPIPYTRHSKSKAPRGSGSLLLDIAGSSHLELVGLT